MPFGKKSRKGFKWKIRSLSSRAVPPAEWGAEYEDCPAGPKIFHCLVSTSLLGLIFQSLFINILIFDTLTFSQFHRLLFHGIEPWPVWFLQSRMFSSSPTWLQVRLWLVFQILVEFHILKEHFPGPCTGGSVVMHSRRPCSPSSEHWRPSSIIYPFMTFSVTHDLLCLH